MLAVQGLVLHQPLRGSYLSRLTASPVSLDGSDKTSDLLQAAGIVVHPSPGHFSGTLVNALLHHLKLPSVEVQCGHTHELEDPGKLNRLNLYLKCLYPSAFVCCFNTAIATAR